MRHIRRSEKFRKLVPGRCQHCGQQLFYKHGSRPRKFCSRGCQQADFRHARYLYPKRDERCPKSLINSETFRPEPPAFEVLGNGHRWPGTIDRELVREIVATEIGEQSPTVTPEQTHLINQIPADLSIPNFLRRVPEIP